MRIAPIADFGLRITEMVTMVACFVSLVLFVAKEYSTSKGTKDTKRPFPVLVIRNPQSAVRNFDLIRPARD
jgi:hypothetical protein